MILMVPANDNIPGYAPQIIKLHRVMPKPLNWSPKKRPIIWPETKPMSQEELQAYRIDVNRRIDAFKAKHR